MPEGRGLLNALGLPPGAATAAHAAAVWGSEQVALPALDVAPPAIFWGPREIAIDALHHTVYAIATGIAYEMLSVRRRAPFTVSYFPVAQRAVLSPASCTTIRRHPGIALHVEIGRAATAGGSPVTAAAGCSDDGRRA